MMGVNMKIRHLVVLIVMLILSLSVSLTSAQSPSNTCATVVQEAFNNLGTNCANMPENSVCFGSSEIQVLTFDENLALAFENPADRASLSQIASLQSSDLNVTENEWGIAVLRTRANLPITLDGQGVVMIMFDDLELVNEVPEELAYYPEVSVDVTVQSDTAADMLSFPPNWGNRQSEVIGTVADGDILSVDAISTDGQWLRAEFLYDPTEFTSRATAWINVSDIASEGLDLSEVAVITPASRTPMQSLTFMNSFADPQCEEQLPAQLFIQGPSTIESEITLFSLDIRVTSTMTSYLIPRGPCRYDLRLIPITSYILIPDPNDPDNIDAAIIVEAGQYIDIPLICDTDGKLIVDPNWLNSFSDQKDLFETNIEEGRNFLSPLLTQILTIFRLIAGNILNYPIDQTPIIITPSSIGNPRPIFEAFIPRPRS